MTGRVVSALRNTTIVCAGLVFMAVGTTILGGRARPGPPAGSPHRTAHAPAAAYHADPAFDLLGAGGPPCCDPPSDARPGPYAGMRTP